MKKIIFLSSAIIFMSVFNSNYAHAQITFIKTYGGNGLSGELGMSVEQTTDGGYIAVGSGYMNINVPEIFLVKTNMYGNLIWAKTFGGSSWDKARCVKQTNDGGYIVAGNTYSFGFGYTDIYVIKTDSNGNALWTKTYGDINYEDVYSILQTSDSGYLISGSNYNGVYLVKTDSGGNVAWTKNFNGYYWSFLLDQTNDGGFIMSRGADNLTKIDSSGNIQWSKSYSVALPNTPIPVIVHSIQQTSDGGFVICGNSSSTSQSTPYMSVVRLIKTDGNGNMLWNKNFNVWSTINDYCDYSARQTADGGFVLVGSVQITYLDDDFCLLKTNSAGNLLWAKSIDGGGDIGIGHSIRQTSDGGFIIVGEEGDCVDGLCLIKTDSNGNVGCNQTNTSFNFYSVTMQLTTDTTILYTPGGGITTPATNTGSGGYVTTMCTPIITGNEVIDLSKNSISIFPNPATNELRIQNAELRIEEIEIYNVLGEKRLTPALSKGEGVSVDVSSMEAGIYFVRVKTEKGIRAAMFVKE